MVKSPKSPPNGGKVRPWEAVGMSRASWYRHGGPTKKPGAMAEWFRREEIKHWKSKRTVERVNRIMEFDGDLWNLMVDGHFKPAQAERIICDPVEYQRFLEWYATHLDLTEYVLWIVRRQLDELEGFHPQRRAPLGIRKSAQGKTVIYLPDKSSTASW